MHKVISGMLKDFSKSYHFDEGHSASKQLEYYINFLIVSSKSVDTIQPYDITTQDDDAAIDGIAILVEGELITNLQELIDIFENTKRKLHVEVLLTQVKSAEKFEKRDIANFLTGIMTFLDENTSYPQGSFNKLQQEILFYVLDNVRYVQNNLPDIEVFYCTTGTYRDEKEIKCTFQLIEKTIEEKTYFNNIKVNPVGTSEIIKLDKTINNDLQVKIKVKEVFPMPESKNIPSSYLSLVGAKEYVDKLLFNEDKIGIRANIFDENIRAYLGDDEAVNGKIQKSLRALDTNSIFSILNNGITIIAPELYYSPNKKEIDLTNYQIINGCQTSNILFQNYNELNDETNIIVKFIGTQDNETINHIISSTNSQSHVDDNAFLSLRDKAKMVQDYFLMMNQESEENTIYFERRKNEFYNMGILSTRVFDLRSIVQAYSSMFLDIPHLSSRYVKQIFREKTLFQEDDAESYYYVATLCLYKTQVMINSKKFTYSNLKWHFLYAFKYLVLKKERGYERNSNKATKNAEALISVLNNKSKFEKIVKSFNEIIEKLGIPTMDVLKRQKFTSDLRESIFQKINESR